MISTGEPSSSTDELLMFGHLAEPGIERRDAEVTLAQEASTTTPKRWLRSLATTTGIGSPGRRPGPARGISPPPAVSSSTLRRLDQAHELAVEQDVRLPFEVADLVRVEHSGCGRSGRGEGVRLAGDLDEQRPDDRDA